MNAVEIIEEIRNLPPEGRQTVYQFLSRDLAVRETSLYDEFTLLGGDSEGCDVGYAFGAQSEVVRHNQ